MCIYYQTKSFLVRCMNRPISFLQVVDNDESIGIFCGNNLPDLITSTSDKLIVNTVIQNTATVMDFEAHFSVIGKHFSSMYSTIFHLFTI